MNVSLYAPDAKPSVLHEADDLLAAHPVIGRHGALVCRWPKERPARGVIVFCHGLGSNGREYAALSRHWAAHGYLVIHPTFADAIGAVARAEPALGLDPASDLGGWTALPDVRTRMHEILHSPAAWLARIGMVGAVMDALPDIVNATCGGAAADLPRAIAGHSFGAYTAQLLAGAEIDLPARGARTFRDDRFAAAILLSAQGRDQQGLRAGSWDAMTGPVLNVTGTLDRGAKGGDWRWKSEPYELAPAGQKYLAVLDDADHYLGGFAESGMQRQVPAQREAVKAITLAFFDAHLRGLPAARAWLAAIGAEIGGCPLLFRGK